jgi:hypothetical protein
MYDIKHFQLQFGKIHSHIGTTTTSINLAIVKLCELKFEPILEIPNAPVTNLVIKYSFALKIINYLKINVTKRKVFVDKSV